MKGQIKKISKSIALALSMGILSPAYGTVHILTNHDEPTSDVATYSQTGVSNEYAPVRKGYGEDMPLETSLEIIVPDGWNVEVNEGALDELVDWEGGATWPYVLKDLSERNDISVSINWNDRTIDLFAHRTEAKRLAAIEEAETTRLIAERAERTVDVEMELEKEAELRKQLELDAKMLSKELEDSKAAEAANQEYIASLEEEREQLVKLGDELSSTLEEKSTLLSKKEKVLKELTNEQDRLTSELEELKFANVETNEQELTEVNVEALKKTYKTSFILPIDDSFEFYVQGGYEEEFDYYTPATYVVKGNITLKENMEQWVKGIGWHLEWKTGVRYPVKYTVKFEGTFKESSTNLINLYRESKRPLDIDFYPDSKVVVVSDLTHKFK